MKCLLPLMVSASLLALPYNAPPPTVDLATLPKSLQPTPQVGLLLPAVGVGVAAGIAGWAGIRMLDQILRQWEHRITNTPPAEVDVIFTWAEDEYP